MLSALWHILMIKGLATKCETLSYTIIHIDNTIDHIRSMCNHGKDTRHQRHAIANH